MVTHLSLVVTKIVVNGTCIMNLDYITEIFKSNCFMTPKDLNNTYCLPCDRNQLFQLCGNCFRGYTCNSYDQIDVKQLDVITFLLW